MDQPLEVVIRALSDKDLKLIITFSLAEQRRRFRKTVVKCKERTTEGLPNIIFKNLSKQ